jgi:hypothetical protein
LNQFQVKRKMYALGIPFRKKERWRCSFLWTRVSKDLSAFTTINADIRLCRGIFYFYHKLGYFKDSLQAEKESFKLSIRSSPKQ